MRELTLEEMELISGGFPIIIDTDPPRTDDMDSIWD